MRKVRLRIIIRFDLDSHTAILATTTTSCTNRATQLTQDILLLHTDPLDWREGHCLWRQNFLILHRFDVVFETFESDENDGDVVERTHPSACMEDFIGD